ncbi:type III pantothenate kinase [Rubrobacter marinus]|uniref:Type III pantothenate kinase n=1 Tax=Rubrobacter marinus TaxID=2653852 RepID=A0A6G8PV38_9ACTN|nr:type III pantothenate kinase [Rubrobacter marinus]QIN78053.1 type III pantothenate kinase [Rubrobacter marinus]
MLLAVDIGNTQTVLGVFEGEELRERWRVTTEANRTADEVGAVCATLLNLAGIPLGDVEALIASSVVPGLTRSYEDLASKLFRAKFYEVTPRMETGLDNRYEDPGSVGADRIVNAVATGRYYGFPAVIVDIGTATTVEAVDGDGCYLGGAIFTGLNVALDALIARTAKLPSVDLAVDPVRAIATNTPDSLRSGFIYGYAGAIDALIRRLRAEMGAHDLRAVATGGPAPVIARHCEEIGVLDPDLTLKGLRLLYEMNA